MILVGTRRKCITMHNLHKLPQLPGSPFVCQVASVTLETPTSTSLAHETVGAIGELQATEPFGVSENPQIDFTWFHHSLWEKFYRQISCDSNRMTARTIFRLTVRVRDLSWKQEVSSSTWPIFSVVFFSPFWGEIFFPWHHVTHISERDTLRTRWRRRFPHPWLRWKSKPDHGNLVGMPFVHTSYLSLFFYMCLKQSPCQNLRPCGHCPSVTCFMVRNVDLEEKTHESINSYVSQIRSNLSLALCKAKVSVTCVQLLLSIALFSWKGWGEKWWRKKEKRWHMMGGSICIL